MPMPFHEKNNIGMTVAHCMFCRTHILCMRQSFCGWQGQKIKQQDISSWLTGIQEVPLSLQYKMRNIDETEAAKKRLLASIAPA